MKNNEPSDFLLFFVMGVAIACATITFKVVFSVKAPCADHQLGIPEQENGKCLSIGGDR